MGGFLDLAFPGRCARCGASGWPLCDACAAGVPVAVPPWCARCGRPVEEPIASCAECPPRAVHRVRAPFIYEGPVAAVLRGLKFKGWRALGAGLAAAMALVAGDLAPADVVTWVPLARARRAERGFDQAEVLARAVGSRLGLPVAGLLARARDTPPQARLPGARRRRAMAGAFVPRSAAPRSVVLVDDVLTTGATAAACARALRSAGARRVDVLVASRSLRSSVPARCLEMGAEGAAV